MSSHKRKVSASTLNRRVRVRREASPELEYESDISQRVSSPVVDSSDSGSGVDVDIIGTDNPKAKRRTNSTSEDEESDGSSDSDSNPEGEEAAGISFGALAKAQASLSRPKKSHSSKDGSFIAADGWSNNEAKERKAGRKDQRDFARSSKHAPVEMSSKKAVSRKREIIPVVERKARDPRFEAVSGVLDTDKVQRAYGFLDDYRDDEMKEMRATIKKCKDEDEKERLKRALLSMESRKKTQMRKKAQEEVLLRHKKEEKELVAQGKRPYFLKESEKKRMVLVETYKGMKKGQVDHAIERRRRKIDQKEKKKLPFARRNLDA